MAQIVGGRYQIIKFLGEGGFAETYLAEDIHLPDRPLRVVKVLKPQFTDPTSLQIAQRLFDTEAKILYQLGTNDRIPQLFAHFEENGQFYLVQEFIDGKVLSEEILPNQPLKESQVIQLIQDILEVLEFVHQQGVIHRDIKPSNLIRRQSDNKIFLIDFGAVKQVVLSTHNTQAQLNKTISIGTPGYIPPEQASGQPKFCSDIYAVGVLAIQALTGISPHLLPQDPNTLEIIWRNGVSVSSGFAAILDKMTRYQFSQRYQNATEALAAIHSLGQVTVPDPLKKPRKFKLWMGLAGLAIALATATFFGLYFSQLNSPQPGKTPFSTPSKEPTGVF
jgi:serine/threonine protein kinase